MGSFAKAYANNPDTEIGGVWVEYSGGIELLMRRAGGINESFQKTVARKLEPHQRKLKHGEIPEETSRRLLAEAYAESIILDWRNVEDENGQPIPFSREACIDALINYPDFFVAVRADAENRAMFAVRDREADAKN